MTSGTDESEAEEGDGFDPRSTIPLCEQLSDEMLQFCDLVRFNHTMQNF